MARNRILIATAALAMATGMAACSTGNSPESNANSTDTGGDDSGAPSIAFIQGVIGDEFYISMECGVRAAADEFGAEVSVQGPQKWDPALQQPIVASVTATEPDAILIAPNDVSALQRPLEEAAQNSKIVLVDTTIEDPSIAVSEIASDNIGGGAAAFEAIQNLVPDGGKVLVIDNQPGISTSVDRVKGFEEAVAKDPKFEYVGVQYAKNQPAKAADIVTSTLQRYPDLKAIFATNIFSAEGAATGIQQAGAVGEVDVVGFDAGPAQVDALEDGVLQAIIAQQPYDIGYQGVEQAIAAINGEPTEEKIQTGFTIVTKENLDTEEGQAALYASEC
ncbi:MULTISPECIES: ABC transporter substrate-binding protein [unclassified Pseudactinotalea]|uniref:ABC transporter substrate-binding protein n=1 Tax=unclassified Pseudactinotalea TaxID=2649176 RepID=UPI00128B5731|nr:MULTISPECIES: ABC transporter substrate-binding protein [unclassified Pseudactinotalea]MPV49673.1 substrate-binding domain-containing protein [Pseudactinotalea sp. HY160]QGH69644.1 substrate-binding domain-containing protein [Pseudactinotalea sp. HY158]